MSDPLDPSGRPDQPGGAAPGNGTTGSSTARKHRRWWVIGAVAAAVVVVAAAVITGVAIGGSSSSAALVLIPSSRPGPNPFTASVASSAPAVSDAVVRKSAQLRTTLPVASDTHIPVAGGTTPGLYGGSGATHVCDPQRLVSFLQANPAKAAAWAQVLGIARSGIQGYVAKLTPVILNSDTLVENHGYRAGTATAFPAVLQAGTAVMVDATGTPRVKCNCGNPLSEPTLVTVSSTATTGNPWAGYSARSVISVRPGRASGELTLVDVGTGQTYAQQVGSSPQMWATITGSSSSGGALVDQSDVWSSSDGTTWNHLVTVPNDFLVSLAWGDGHWVAVGTPRSDTLTANTTDILTSDDLTSWRLVASEPGEARGIAFGNGRWVIVAVTQDTTAVGGQGIVYTSTNGTDWAPAPAPTGPITTFGSIAFGKSGWMATASRIDAAPIALFASADGVNWTSARTGELDQTGGHIAYGAGSWLLAASTGKPFDTQTNQPAANDVLIDTSTDGSTWRTAAPASLMQQADYAIGFGGGRWLMATEDSTLPNPFHAFVITRVLASSDGSAWSPIGQLVGPVVAFAYGELGSSSSGTGSPGQPAPVTPAPTSAQPSQIPPTDSSSGNSALPSPAPVGVRSKLTDAQIAEMAAICPDIAAWRPDAWAQGLRNMPDAMAEYAYTHRDTCATVQEIISAWIAGGEPGAQ